MSYRRSVSFSECEKELLREFDTNGKSDFAKEAMKYYLKYKDKIIPDEVKIEILKLVGNNGVIFKQEEKRTNIEKTKLNKLIK